MIKKEFTPKRTVCKVTFSIPAEWAQNEVAIAGEFNDWDTTGTKLKRNNGHWTTQVRLKPNAEYMFKYLIDGERWENDDAADEYVSNTFGTEDSVVKTDA